MRGMFLRDWRGLWPWLVCGFLGTACLYPWSLSTQGTAIWNTMLLQIYGMCALRSFVREDRMLGWDRYTAVFPNGRRRYAGEKIVVLLVIWAVMLFGIFTGRLLQGLISYHRLSDSLVFDALQYPTDLFGYLWYMLAPDSVYDLIYLPVVGSFGEVYLFTMTAVQLPVLLFLPTAFSVLWDVVTWFAAFMGIFWLQSGFSRAFLAAKKAGNLPKDIEELQVLEYFSWQDIPWDLLVWPALVLLVLSAGICLWYAGRRRTEVQPFGKGRKHMLTVLRTPLLLLIGAGLLVGTAVEAWMELHPVYKTYVYSREDRFDARTVYEVTDEEPAEKLKYNAYSDRPYTLAGMYATENPDAKVYNAIGGKLLVWDGEWLLYDLETEEKTVLALDAQPQRIGILLLGTGEPLAIAVDRKANECAYFSIRENRMMTEYIYPGVRDEYLHDGIIRTFKVHKQKYKEDSAVYYEIDPITWEITEVKAE